MANFLLLYNGPATDPMAMTEDQRNESMQQWVAWMGKVGDSMVDMGLPTKAGVAIADDGSEAQATLVNGYTIISADDLDGAKSLVEDHPFLNDSDGKFKIEIFELLPMPGMPE